MTTLREAAQQALEALELGYDSAKAEADQYHAAMAGYRPQRHAEMDADVQKIAAAITALRAALAEPVLNPAPGYCKHCKQYTIEEPLPAEPVQKPVAWTGYDLDAMVEAFDRVIEAHFSKAHPFHDPTNMDAKMALRILRGFIPAMKAYTDPPKRKPLTEEEIDSIWDSEKAFADIYAIARAIERAHGITP